MQIYIGNLPPELDDAGLRALVEEYGTVRTAQIGVDAKTGASEGYALVEMPVKSEARAAVEGLRGKEFKGNQLRAKILKPNDPFHEAMRPKKQGTGGGSSFRGEGSYRGSGAIRRGGQRGG